MKKVIVITIITLMLILSLVFQHRIYSFFESVYYLGAFLLYDPYKYHYFCFETSDKCLTVITYSKPSFGDNPFKRYVVFGKKKYKVPPKTNYIEFPNDTNMVIIWESASRCKIVSNDLPEKVMELSRDVKIEIISNNVEYEKYRKKFPDLDL